ncbi:acyl-CoA N-acyltransferase [Hypoxylon sp. FL0890]|nr:acyl-CoA N-acyltransferase [Hypoxylon sp. FL0890]
MRMELNNRPTSATPIVEQATESDIPDLIALWWDAFGGDFIRRIYPQSPDGRRWLERAFAKNFGPTPGPGVPETKCLIVRSPENNLPAAIAVYRIVPAGCDPAQCSWRARWPRFDDLPDVREDVVASFFDPMDKTHTYLLGNRGHVYLEVLGTMEAHRKRGYATALIKWGTDLADDLGVECYLDASPDGKPLYEANGYVEQDVSAVVNRKEGSSMVRPRKQLA